MSNPNFVSDLVAMAKAFEELPQVREELDKAKRDLGIDAETIQRLELRIMDLKNELAVAHEATRKAEVERDHAEQMFLETDDRLNAFQRLLQSFQSDANSLVKASEPAPIEQVSLPQAEASPVADPAPASTDPTHADLTSGQSDVDPTTASTPISTDTQKEIQSVSSVGDTSTDSGVSVPSDPTSSSAETSFENVSSASTSESTPLPEPGGFSMQPIQPEEGVPAAGTLYSADPTASSPAGDTLSPASAPIDAAASVADAPAVSAQVVDDIGYHNEPKIGTADGSQDWEAWDAWAKRMDKRYPAHLGGWPQRPTQAAQ